ncbi:MAG: hypothetical protein ACKVP5_13970 [Aestuariivirga sp.]
MNNDVFYAILAMDAYNQGYGAGIVGVGAEVGNASIIRTTLATETEAVDESFAATAYRWNGETIISYRGTDSITGDAGDWGGGGGFQTDQAWLGAQFYRAVIANDINTPGIYDANVTFTGHSQGGGLAGLLARI